VLNRVLDRELAGGTFERQESRFPAAAAGRSAARIHRGARPLHSRSVVATGVRVEFTTGKWRSCTAARLGTL
jgi:hypothetical protein